MRPRQYKALAPLTEEAISHKGIKIIWNDALEEYFNKLKRMVSAKMLLNYPYLMIHSTVITDDSDTQLVTVISQGKKPTDFSKED